jgi:flagellin-like protein
MKKIWRIRKDSEAVSPVIATILMVAITVVLAAVLYVMVLGFGGTSTQTPAATYQKATMTNGQKITIVSITKTDVPWDDVTIQVSDGTTIQAWTPTKAGIIGTSAVALGAKVIGTLTVYVNLTDVSGNGYVSGTDYFTVVAHLTASPFTGGFVTNAAYTAVLLYEPSGERCGQPITFTG